MGCHSWIDDTDKPALTYLKTYWEDEEPIAWTKVHDLPDFAYFNHSIHVQPGLNKDGEPSTQRVACQECHGNIQERTVAVREATLEMGWCLDCHENHESIDHNYKDKAQVRRAEIKDCWTCHN